MLEGTKFVKNHFVLLVEDDPLVQKVHFFKLKNLGCKVDVASNGIKALEMYPKGYEIIFLDCGLPDISGIEVGKKIRANEMDNNLKRIPIVMITAFANNLDLRYQCKEAGIDELIIKPIMEDSTWKRLLSFCYVGCQV